MVTRTRDASSFLAELSIVTAGVGSMVTHAEQGRIQRGLQRELSSPPTNMNAMDLS